MSNIGYVRSASGHEDAMRLEKSLGTGIDLLFSDIVQEHGAGSPELNRMMAILKEGDKLFVPSLSTLSRSVRDILQLIEILDGKKVAFASIEEGFDSETAEGKSTMKVLKSLMTIDVGTMEEWKKDYIESAKRRMEKAPKRATRQKP